MACSARSAVRRGSLQANGQPGHLGPQGIDRLLGIRTGRARGLTTTVGEATPDTPARAGSGIRRIRRRCHIFPIQPGGLLFHFLPEEAQFLLEAGRGVLGQQGEAGGGVGQATAEAGRQPVCSRLQQGLGGAHGRIRLLKPLCCWNCGRSGLGCGGRGRWCLRKGGQLQSRAGGRLGVGTFGGGGNLEIGGCWLGQRLQPRGSTGRRDGGGGPIEGIEAGPFLLLLGLPGFSSLAILQLGAVFAGVRLILLVAFLLLQGSEIDNHILGSIAVTATKGLEGLTGESLDSEVLMAGGTTPIALGPDQSIGDAMAEPKASAKGQPITPVAAGGGAGAGNRNHGRRGVGMDLRRAHPARYVLNCPPRAIGPTHHSGLGTPVAITFSIRTHDSWGVVPVGDFPTLEEARQVFSALCQDPWYKADGTVKGVELVQTSPAGEAQRLEWFSFQ